MRTRMGISPVGSLARGPSALFFICVSSEAAAFGVVERRRAEW
jgi:hypothetical protein